MVFFKDKIDEAVIRHDFDKLTEIDHFRKDFSTGFKETGWWKNHQKVNRHHLLEKDGIPEDVNLVDVLDMVTDCVMAGMGRAGSVYELKIEPETLKKAFDNTVEMLKSQIVVKEKQEPLKGD